jgi:hypothetical protein
VEQQANDTPVELDMQVPACCVIGNAFMPSGNVASDERARPCANAQDAHRCNLLAILEWFLEEI